MIVEIQVLPNVSGISSPDYQHVDAAIAAIDHCGLNYEVGALGTTIEGEPDRVWPLLREVHEACLKSGATSLVTMIKIHQTVSEQDEVSIAVLTDKFRDKSSRSKGNEYGSHHD